jgi:hypothetical protein
VEFAAVSYPEISSPIDIFPVPGGLNRELVELKDYLWD